MKKVNVKLRWGAGISGASKQGDDLSKLNVTELAEAYVESVQTAEATEHVGKANRLARHR